MITINEFVFLSRSDQELLTRLVQFDPASGKYGYIVCDCNSILDIYTDKFFSYNRKTCCKNCEKNKFIT